MNLERQRKHRILVLVETPFQLLCAYEYMLTHDAKYKICIRNSGVGTNDMQMACMVRDIGLAVDQIIAVAPGRRLSGVMATLTFIKTCFGCYDKVLLGSYFSRLLKLFSSLVYKHETVLLDDGVATLLADQLIRNRVRGAYSIFTIFDLCRDAYLDYKRHIFDATKSELLAKSGKSIESRITPGAIFIGQKMVEIEALDAESYIQAIAWAVKKSAGHNFYYIPHRGELADNVVRIGKIPGVKILPADGAIEYFILRNGWTPKYFFSIQSTALITLASLYPEAGSYAIFPASLKRELFPHWDIVRGYIADHGSISVCESVV